MSILDRTKMSIVDLKLRLHLKNLKIYLKLKIVTQRVLHSAGSRAVERVKKHSTSNPTQDNFGSSSIKYQDTHIFFIVFEIK